jgi:8-oxo-dGTP pyrophosphatase MutT (NUDIX family)
VAEPVERTAAVLVPFYRDTAGELWVVLIERAPGGRHGGQIALPGGNREPADETLRDTAIRETGEELGIDPRLIDVLGVRPPMRTRSTGYVVTPHIGRLRAPVPSWRPQAAEVAAVLPMRVADLVDPAGAGRVVMDFPAWHGPMEGPIRTVDGHVVWGLTLRILDDVLPRAVAGEWPVGA